MKFGVHKLWFTYTDEWYVTYDKLATQVGIYNSFEEANKVKVQMDIKALKNMNSSDYIRDLTSFMEKNDYKSSCASLVNFAKSQGWNDFLRERFYSNSGESYFELSFPKDVTDEQLVKILNITGAYFHKIIEYKEVEKSAYIKFNHAFWGTKIFKVMKEKGIIDERSPNINGVKHKGKFLVQKTRKGRKSATIKDTSNGISEAIKVSLKYMKEYPEYHFLGKTYIDELSNYSTTLATFINSCKSISLDSELITESNKKKIQSKLKKMKSDKEIAVGESFNTVRLPQFENAILSEVKGFFQLLRIQPFTVFEIYSEVNGEKIHSYIPDFGTF